MDFKQRLEGILEKQRAKLAEMKQAGEAQEKIDKMELAIKCTERRIEKTN